MKRFIAILLAMAMVLAMTACGAKEEPVQDGNDNPTEETRTLKLSHHYADEHGCAKMVTRFAELVKEKTNGSLDIEIYSNSALGGQSENLEMIAAGSIDMTITDTGVLGNYAPSITIFDMPYVFDSIEHARKVMENEAGAAIMQDVTAASGIRPLSMQAVMFRSTLLNDIEATTPADFVNVKVRTPENSAIVSTFEALGATPVVTSSGEAYTAVQTGVADGLEGNAEFIVQSKYYEVAKTWINTEHILSCTALSINDKTYNSLTVEQQKAVDEAAVECLDYFYGLYDEIGTNSYAALEEAGVKFIEIDKTLFREAVSSVVEKFVAENGLETTWEAINAARG